MSWTSRVLDYWWPATVDADAVPLRTRVRRPPGWKIATPGWIYNLSIGFMAAAALNTNASLLFGVLGLMVGILLVCIRIGRIVMRRLTIARELPEAGTVNEPLDVTYRFTNRKRFWPTISVSVDEQDGVEAFVRQPRAYLVHAPPSGTVGVPVTLLPKRRGLHQLDRYVVSTGFPFGFLRQATERRRADSIVVYPPVGRVDPRVLAMAEPAEKTGPTMRPRRGGSDELYGLKEFRNGENPRTIHWRRSARTGVLVAKEMTQVAPPRLVLMVDTFLPRRTRAAHAKVEEAIAMAASVASHALEQGVTVGLLAWGGAESGGWVSIPPTRGKRQRRDVMTALARLPANVDHDRGAVVANVGDLMEPGTTALLFTPAADAGGGGGGGLASEAHRGSVVTVPVDGPQSKAWFTFAPGVRFDRCCPPDQEDGIVG